MIFPMTNYIISAKAKDDLRKIWSYTLEKWSEKQAETYYGNLVNAFDYIAFNPFSAGHPYNEVSDGLRGMTVNKHIVFYRILKNDKVRIIRILHSRMDIKRHKME